MNEENLLLEAGVYYCFPEIGNPDSPCPNTLTEYKYKRFRDGELFGIQRVFILGSELNFFKLLNSWNTKGISNGYCYIAD